MLFKVKVQRWRGAVWRSADLLWIIAGGHREDGSTEDFYASLVSGAKAARAQYNSMYTPPLSTATYVGHLLPEEDDHIRWRAEAGVRLLRRLRQTVRDLVRGSLDDGREHSADFGTFVLGIHVRTEEDHETYVAVRITGSVPDNIAYVVLDLVPGCDRDSWFPEPRLPERSLYGAEQAWSTLMDPKTASELRFEQP